MPARPARLLAASLSACVWLLTALLWWGAFVVPARAALGEAPHLEVYRTPEGVLLDMEVPFDLAPGVEDALQKGVALHFVAEADLFRARWYWRDRRVASATRMWRLTYQPLTGKYRIGQGGLSQTFTTLREALSVIRRPGQWRIADALPPDDDGRYYLEVRFKLDTTQLPRPLQIGIGSQPEWSLGFERTLPVGLPALPPR